MTSFSNKSVILFDLDGTVINSKEGIFNSIYYVFEKLSMKEDDTAKLNKFIGPSIASSFKNLYNMAEEEAVHAVNIYREYYKNKGVFECHAYDGLEDLLIKLKKQNKKIGIATKKPEPYAILALEKINLAKYFDLICGSSFDETNDDKSHIISRCANELSDGNLTSVIHIGDTHYDIIGAKKANVDCIGVLYGFGKENELINKGANAIAKDMEELKKMLTE